MKRLLLRTFVLVLFTVAAAYQPMFLNGHARPQDEPSCSTYQKCNELGTAALQHGRVDEAIKLFEQQAGFAELADIERQRSPGKLALTAYNNLAVAYMAKHDYLRARTWALVALDYDKNNPATRFNMDKIEQALRGWQWPSTPEGEYVLYAGRGTWESMIVERSSGNSVDFCFSGLWWGLGEGPSGLGELKATVKVQNQEAKYTSDQCSISMHFYPDRLEVKQSGRDLDCGFGHNVTAEGTFQRVSSKAKCAAEER